ncbi:MAG TPA: acetyl-CoA carboxylase, biotin carboxyl carrier protein, partial [Allosphingosinicella sp.]|nr:acetyl-CoA carboxylase, biotin carboxyl carrier protein [Allosphingosinicella sp.]
MTKEKDGAGGGMRVDADLVRSLAEMLNTNDLTEIEVEDGDRRIVVKRQVTVQQVTQAAPAPAPAAAAPAPAAPAPAAAAADI